MAPKPTSTDNPKSLSDLGLENFVMETMHRSEIKGAIYNPRLIGDAEKRKLKAALKKHGMVSPVTWNRRTKNLVGGHQRLSILDALAGTSNFTLSVAVIDVDDEREKEINILLNNQEAQGGWDLEKLGSIFQTTKLDHVGTGFDEADLFRLFGNSPLATANNEVDELALQLDKFRETFAKIDSGKKDYEEGSDFYFVAIFRNGADCETFLKRHNLPDERYQSGEQIDALIQAAPSPASQQMSAASKTQAAPDKAPGS